uniref:Uncharacterized protein n=1 Tax=Micrurus corallinus TaxID=54390 RepID=A0A2D4F307_MICCO
MRFLWACWEGTVSRPPSLSEGAPAVSTQAFRAGTASLLPPCQENAASSDKRNVERKGGPRKAGQPSLPLPLTNPQTAGCTQCAQGRLTKHTRAVHTSRKPDLICHVLSASGTISAPPTTHSSRAQPHFMQGQMLAV